MFVPKCLLLFIALSFKQQNSSHYRAIHSVLCNYNTSYRMTGVETDFKQPCSRRTESEFGDDSAC